MSSSISPLAPKHVPDMPAIAGVRLATAAGRHPLQGPHRRAAGAVRRRHHRRRRVHALEVPVGAGRVVPRQPQGRQGARALVVNSGNANAFTGKSGREATASLPRRSPRKAAGCKIGRGLPRFDRRHRRAARRREAFDGVMDELATTRARGRLPRCGQGDHDHRHLPEGGDRNGEDRRHEGHASTASPRAPA